MRNSPVLQNGLVFETAAAQPTRPEVAATLIVDAGRCVLHGRCTLHQSGCCVAHRWRRTTELHHWSWCGKHCRRWRCAAHSGSGRDALYHRSKRSVSYVWSWRDVLVDRRQCSIHCRCRRSTVHTGCRTDVLHQRVPAQCTLQELEQHSSQQTLEQCTSHRRWCGRHRVKGECDSRCQVLP